jgi:hypothetical protein
MSEERPNSVIEIHKTLFEGLDVTRALFHQSVDFPNGGGQATSAYFKPGTGIGRSALTGVKMKYNQDGLFCEYKGSILVIPLANVVAAYL